MSASLWLCQMRGKRSADGVTRKSLSGWLSSCDFQVRKWDFMIAWESNSNDFRSRRRIYATVESVRGLFLQERNMLFKLWPSAADVIKYMLRRSMINGNFIASQLIHFTFYFSSSLFNIRKCVYEAFYTWNLTSSLNGSGLKLKVKQNKWKK